ncbi:hypothetical protein Hanom_Chr04g00287281 [Helianthus anomalus]
MPLDPIATWVKQLSVNSVCEHICAYFRGNLQVTLFIARVLTGKSPVIFCCIMKHSIFIR